MSEQEKSSAVYLRRIRSFVKREGRLTKGQASAFERLMPTWGVTKPLQPIQFAALFGREGPVTLEIGFGMGHSLVAMAKAAPERNFFGVEVHRPGVGALLMEAEQEGVQNVRVAEHDAVEVLEHWLADASLDRVQIFFPDPWHKARHHKRRLIQAEFVQLLRRKLQLGGVLHLATDWEHYAEHMLAVMNAAAGYKNLASDNTYIPRPEERPLTKFEQRGHRLGHGVWDLQFQVTAVP